MRIEALVLCLFFLRFVNLKLLPFATNQRVNFLFLFSFEADLHMIDALYFAKDTL